MTPTRHSGFDVMQAGQLKQLRTKRWATLPCGMGLGMLGLSASAFVQSADPVEWQLNMGRGVTALSNHAYDAHMMALWICVGIGVVVFAAMAYARSEEHTSELQSLMRISYAVFCLKKKTTIKSTR